MSDVPNPEHYILDINGYIFQSLVLKLQRNESWRIIAKKYNSIFDEEELELDPCPSLAILQELGIKKCKVKELQLLLNKLRLIDAAALLSEPEPMAIQVQPGAEDCIKFISYGGELKLEIQATGIPPPKYLWHCDNEELSKQQNSVLIINNFEPGNEGEYRCLVTQDSPSGHLEQFSTSVNVQMIPEPPTIQEQPKPISVRVGNEIILSCKAVSYPFPKYEWMRLNTVLSDQNSCTLKISQASLEDAGDYKCHITNGFNEIYSEEVNVSVHEIPIDLINPERRMTIVEEKLALLFVNANYSNLSELLTPYNDAKALSDALMKIGFKVLTLCDLNLIEMKNAIKTFCDLLPEGAYAIVYFAGHGFELHDKYMLPIDCPGPDLYCCSESLSERYVIREVLKRKPLLMLLMLDMCLILPNREKNPHIFSENVTPIPFEPQRNLIQAYATTSNLGAYERKSESNGIYMKHLLKYLIADLPVECIFQGVNTSLSGEKDDAVHLQIPSFTMNVIPNKHYLTVPCKVNFETQRKYVQLTNLQDDIQVHFHKVNQWATIKFHFNEKCFHNSLEIHIYNLQNWNIRCATQSKDIEMLLLRDSDVIILKAQHLQKLMTPSMSLSISLHDHEDKLHDNALFDVNVSISSTALWFKSPNDGSEEESLLGVSYSSPTQSFYSEEEIQDS